MKKKLIITAILSLSLLLGISVFAQPPMPRERGIFNYLKILKENADISKEQEATIKDIIAQAQKERIDIRAQIEKKEIDLHSLMSEYKPNRDKITALVKDIGDLKTQLELVNINQRLDVRAELTEEQWEKIKDIVREPPMHHKGKHPKMHHRNMPDGPPAHPPMPMGR